MNFDFKITIPANTTEQDPYTEVLVMEYGIITDVAFTIPQGHAGLAYLKFLYHEAQLYPLNRPGAYSGNKRDIHFIDFQLLTVNPYELKAVGWNEDELYEHSFFANFTILRPEELNRQIPTVSEDALLKLISEEGEL